MKAEVLDVCCGGKMFYFQPDAPYLCGVDIRKGKYDIGDGRIIGINPDVQCDFRDLPFPDKSFNLVIYDPPHLLRCGDNHSCTQSTDVFPVTGKSIWQRDLRKRGVCLSRAEH